MSFNIAVGIAWGNDPLILRLIESIPYNWDIIIIEGRYENSKIAEHCAPIMIQKVLHYPNVRLYHRTGLEFHVRNKYLEKMSEYDFAIMLDTDEYVIEYNKEDFENSIKNLKQGYHLIDVLYGKESKQQGRFFVNPGKWRYYKSHKYITDGKQIKAIFSADSMIKGIKVRHDDSGRPEHLKQTIDTYQKQLWKYEDGLKI